MIRTADERDNRMGDGRGNRMPEMPQPQDAEPPRGAPASILDGLDTAGFGQIDIAFERPANHRRLARFD